MDRENQRKLAAKCRKFRLERKITQAQVADDLGVSVNAVSHFENGRSSNLNILLWYINHGLELGGFYG